MIYSHPGQRLGQHLGHGPRPLLGTQLRNSPGSRTLPRARPIFLGYALDIPKAFIVSFITYSLGILSVSITYSLGIP